jgi:HPt (histidine-containing phosphotransfer) domain-containing protein
VNTPATPAFDRVELLDRVGNDMAFLAETVEMLAADGRTLLAEVRVAIQKGDAGAVGRSAHALKGMISNFCAPGAQEGALAIEKMGKTGELAGAARAVESLSSQVETLITELQKFVGSAA